ncbi:MAG: hypothetical protein LBT97_03065 [Planctomycetota bacterium]|jgi:hypothetical protein|nr:hypothetical protein [Planctomycetota bacterium]
MDIELIQQGDVQFFRQDNKLVTEDIIPGGGKPVQPKNGRYIFAEGEMTGHHHSAVADDDIQVYEKDGVLYCSVIGDEVTVEHQEHNVVKLPKGDYRVHIVQEVDHLADEVRKVRD